MPRPQWNYRIVKDGDHSPVFTIREVFYDEHDAIVKIIEQDAAPFGESVSELISDLDKMLRACMLPILEIPKIAEATSIQIEDDDGDLD